MRVVVTFKNEDAAGHCIAERYYDAVPQSTLEGLAAAWARELAGQLKARGHRVCMVTARADVEVRAVLLMTPAHPEPSKTEPQVGNARKGVSKRKEP